MIIVFFCSNCFIAVLKPFRCVIYFEPEFEPSVLVSSPFCAFPPFFLQYGTECSLWTLKREKKTARKSKIARKRGREGQRERNTERERDQERDSKTETARQKAKGRERKKESAKEKNARAHMKTKQKK